MCWIVFTLLPGYNKSTADGYRANTAMDQSANKGYTV